MMILAIWIEDTLPMPVQRSHDPDPRKHRGAAFLSDQDQGFHRGLTGNVQVTYDPNTGGAYVNGNLFPPGSPLLDIPFIKSAVERSKADMGGDKSDKSRGHDFTNYFDNLAEQMEGPPAFRDGGVVGRRHFATGGSVRSSSSFAARLDEMGLSRIEIPHLAFGGMPEIPDMGIGAGPVKTSGSSGLDLPHYGTMDLRTDHGDHRVIAHEDTMRSLGAAAQRAKRFSTGAKPSWYGGSA